MDYIIDLIWEWFDDRGLHDPMAQFAKINEEVGEIAHELTRNRLDSNEMYDAIGDTLITLIGFCHHLNIDPIICLTDAYHEIRNRTGKVENGNFVKDE